MKRWLIGSVVFLMLTACAGADSQSKVPGVS